MKETTALPEVDEPPKNGEWATEHPLLTDEEIALGNTLGEKINVLDDEDTGLE